MSIKKLYVCNICSNDHADQLKDGDWNSVRIRWDGSVISLRPLTDNSASETIICAPCIAQLYDAIHKELKR